ncbi:Acetolactate synthase, mitochondrial [Tieghemiomyces parasiticus]|uniref:Acetolactate synthase n=1 Tax=Tieghemiomyces parasiticus TaxID=78921 RepID=A0A9W8DN86_9FUNG|nr:Acetolactate synthase, mitochondrial [Tieghemiomyces parasiticus]
MLSHYAAPRLGALNRCLTTNFRPSVKPTATALRRTLGSRAVSTAKPRASSSPAAAVAESRSTPQPSVRAASAAAPQPLTGQTLRREDGPQYDDSFVGLSGGEIFHEMMLRQDVKHVFGYPGGAILPVFDAIYESKHFEFVLPRHEQGAGHMAEGYARATGKPGVVLVTSGPGATNVITPMQDALSDGVPMVVFSGQVPTTALGTDAFQEADVVGISRACTKWNVMVKDIADLPRRINEAFEIATSGRPGPVLVDLPKDVTAGILNRPIPIAPTIPTRPAGPVAESVSEANRQRTLTRIAELLNQAERPILYVGHGIMGHPDGPAVLKELADLANVPVTTTLMGLGAYDETDPKSLHMLGMHGSAYANLAMQAADLILALGARFDDRVTGNIKKFAPGARRAAEEGRGGIVHFDIMPKNINKVVDVDYAVEGDVTRNLQQLLPLIKHAERAPWHAKLAEWKTTYPFNYDRKAPLPNQLIRPQSVVEELNRQLQTQSQDFIITTGVGQHQMWAAQYIRWKHPRSFITSGGLGTMGYGLPSAIGAKVACPDKMVIDIDGDASFCMTAMELATMSQYKLGVKVLLLNNEFQGMVKQWQDIFYKERYSATAMTNPDFVKLSEAMGVKGMQCADPAKLSDSLKAFIEHDGPVVLEVLVDKRDHVYPMVPGGKALHEIILNESTTLQGTEKLQ